MKRIIKDALILFAITLVAGLLLGYVHDITLEPIRVAQENAANVTYRSVFPQASTFAEDTDLIPSLELCNADPELQTFGSAVSVNAVRKAMDANGQVLGYVINATSKGYGGPVQIAVGISNDGQVTGLGFLQINETPGLGMKAKDAAFTDQFSGMPANGELTLVKTGKTSDDQIDALSGATYTSKAVAGSINAAIYFLNQYAK